MARNSPGRNVRGTGMRLLFSRVTLAKPLNGTSFTSIPSRCSNSPLSHTFSPSSQSNSACIAPNRSGAGTSNARRK